MCAKRIAPASYNALLQLPKDQLRNLVEAQPTLKTGLLEFVLGLSKRTGGNKSKLAGYLEILGDGSGGPNNPAGASNSGMGAVTMAADSTMSSSTLQSLQPQLDGTSGQSQTGSNQPTPPVSTPTMA